MKGGCMKQFIFGFVSILVIGSLMIYGDAALDILMEPLVGVFGISLFVKAVKERK